MDNQVERESENTQQVGQNLVDKSLKIQEKQKVNYWMISTIILAAILILVLGYCYLNFKTKTPAEKAVGSVDSTITPELNNESDNPTKAIGLLAYFKKNQEVWIYKILNGESIRVLPEIDTEKYCGDGCAGRTIDISGDGKYLASDLLPYKGSDWIGMVSIDNPKEVNYLVQGYRPFWNPIKNEFLYEIQAVGTRWTLYDLDQKKSRDLSSDINFPHAWMSQDEVLYLSNEDRESVFIGNIRNDSTRKIKINGSQSIYSVSVSPDKKYFLLGVYRGDGYDVGISKIDGTGYKSISGFTGEAWAGSGYYAGIWSPDSTKLAIKNWFIDKTTRVSANRSLKIVDINGHLIQEFDAKTTGRKSVCWLEVGFDQYIITGSRDGDVSYISLYDFPLGGLTKVENYNFADGTELTCR